MFEGLHSYEWHWAHDSKFVFAAETIAGDPPWIQKGNKRVSNNTYRLMRVDLATGERTAISPNVSYSGFCRDEKWLIWHHVGAGGHGMFWKVKIDDNPGPQEVPVFSEWRPLLALGGGKFVCWGGRAKGRGVVDLDPESSAQGESAPLVRPLNLPASIEKGRLLYSQTRKGLVVTVDSLLWELYDLEGKRLGGWRMDPKERPKGKRSGTAPRTQCRLGMGLLAWVAAPAKRRGEEALFESGAAARRGPNVASTPSETSGSTCPRTTGR